MKDLPRLVDNILSLSGLRFVNMVVSILLIPYLIKTLGIAGFSIIALCQAVVSYGVIFVDMASILQQQKMSHSLMEAAHNYRVQLAGY